MAYGQKISTEANDGLSFTHQQREYMINALKEHKSQIGDPLLFDKRMRARHTEDSTDTSPRYEEKFRVLNFSQ